MNESREQRYLDTQRLIVWFFALSLSLALLSWAAGKFIPEPTPAREVSIAARACFDQGLRAILHSDGTIECRP